MFKKLIDAMKRHKFTSLLVVVAIATAGYFIYQMTTSSTSETIYEVQRVKKGDIEKIISSTGQIADTDQANVNPEVSGKVTAVNTSVGSKVKAGDVLFTIDSSDLESNIHQAQLSLEAAQIMLNEMKEPPDALQVLQAENDLQAARNNLSAIKLRQEQDLARAEDNRDTTQDTLDTLDKDDSLYDNTVAALNEANREIESYLLNHPIGISEAEAAIREKELFLNNIKAGSSSSDIRLQEITVAERQSSLNELIGQRDMYNVTAPRDGIVASIEVAVGDSVYEGGSSASAGTLSASVTIISNKMNVTIVVNELDILSVAKDQKATITFEAVEDLEITGKVSEIDLIGTVDQGVVYHNVTIEFDMQDERLKSGMTANIDIITASKKDILVTPSVAVQEVGDKELIEIVTSDVSVASGEVSGVSTRITEVTTGISDDTNVEIIDGLEVGDVVVLDTKENDVTDIEDKPSDDLKKGVGPGILGGKAFRK